MEVDRNLKNQLQLIDKEILYLGNYKNRVDIKLKQKSRKNYQFKNRMLFSIHGDRGGGGGGGWGWCIITIRRISLMINFIYRVMSVLYAKLQKNSWTSLIVCNSLKQQIVWGVY